jgi:hypothetical protein
MSVAALLAALLAASVAGFAQAQTPTREGNIWDWRNHQPTEADVEQKEKAAGVAPSASERASTAATENHLDRKLLDADHGTPRPLGTDGSGDGSTRPDPNAAPR